MVGQTLAHYEILARLGRGGMGEVYRARDTKLQRDVALKVLPPEMAGDSERLDRFRREARALAALDHPSIVTVYSVEMVNEVHFLTMQLVEGHDLAEIIPDGGLPVDRLVAIASALADALAAAHEKGIVHRDLKPANVMVSEVGRVKVLDFGLAKLTSDPSESADDVTATLEMRTREGVIMGTAPYMSPEQVEGHAVDHRSDLFSLGTLLYEMTTGRRPFRGGSPAALFSAILRDEPATPTRTDLPSVIPKLIEDCLEKDPAERVQTAAEIQARLRAAATVDGSTATRAETPSGIASRHEVHTVGRSSEIDALGAALAAARGGRGALVGVAGEPGMGKTTLVETFLAGAEAAGGCTVARGSCSERLAGSEAYLPILEALDSLIHGADGERASGILEATAPVWHAQIVPLSGPSNDSSHMADEVQDASQERLKREFVALTHELSRTRPLILFLDDLHWADVSTVDLLGYLAGTFDEAGVLVVVTYRPSDLQLAKHPFLQIRPDLQARGRFRELSLGLLRESDTAEYLDIEFPRHRFPAEFSALIHAKTEGNPLFMADLLRYLRDRGAVAEAEGGWVLANGVPEIEQLLPESVRAMIERKIGRLDEEARALLTVASVQGHAFDSAIVARVLDRSPDGVEEQLDVLERVHSFVQLANEAELPGRTLNLRYRFVHALYQNALYADLKPTRRARLSRKVGEAIESVHGAKARGVSHELAMLFETGREPTKAATYYLMAARQANRVFADRESWALADRGLELARTLDPSTDRNALELELLLALGVAVRSAGGFGHPVAREAYTRARALCEEIGETPHLFTVLFGLWELHQNESDLASALDVGQQMLARAERTGDGGHLVASNHAMADNLLCLGDPLGSIEHAAAAVARYVPTDHHALAHHFGYDPGVAAHCMAALSRWTSGHPDGARRDVDSALALAESLSHPSSLAFATLFASWIACWRGEWDDARSMADRCLAYCSEYGLPAYRDFVQICRGMIQIAKGEPDSGADTATEGAAALESIGFRWARSFMLSVVADGRIRAGDLPEALARLEEAFACAERSGEQLCIPELLRLKGEVLLRQKSGDAAAGERCLLEAVEVARRQQALAWELRATITLARWWHTKGRTVEGRERLEVVCSSFIEGLDTADLVAARAVLEELAPPTGA
jgi:predicted ATPase